MFKNLCLIAQYIIKINTTLYQIFCEPTVGPAPFSYFVWQKGVFSPIPPDGGNFIPSQFGITVLLISLTCLISVSGKYHECLVK